jgi:hypothetical protein
VREAALLLVFVGTIVQVADAVLLGTAHVSRLYTTQVLNEKEQALLASEDDTGLLDLIKQMLLPSVTAMNVPVKAEFRLAGFFGTCSVQQLVKCVVIDCLMMQYHF